MHHRPYNLVPPRLRLRHGFVNRLLALQRRASIEHRASSIDRERGGTAVAAVPLAVLARCVLAVLRESFCTGSVSVVELLASS